MITDIYNSKLRFTKHVDEKLIDQQTYNELHPILRKFYLPHTTKPDRNCLFNMISISLVGNESLS